MTIRAGASNREMVQSLGVDIHLLYRHRVRRGCRARRLRRHDRRAGVVGLSRHGQPGADHLASSSSSSAASARFAARWSRRCSIGVVDTFGKVLIPADGRHPRLRADGGDPAVAAGRPVPRRMTMQRRACRTRCSLAAAGCAARAVSVRRRQVLRRPDGHDDDPRRSSRCRSSCSSDARASCRFGHAAFFGIAAYATALLSPQAEAASICMAAARGARDRRARGARRGRAVAAHARHLFHHGDAGIRADGLLRVSRHEASPAAATASTSTSSRSSRSDA